MQNHPTNFSRRRPARWQWLALPAVLLALASGVHADGTVADLDHDNGLPAAQLGAPLRGFGEMHKTDDNGRFLTFTRPGDSLRIEGVEVAGITYNFFKEELYSIDIDVAGTGNVKRMLKLLEKKYGKDHSFENKTYPKTTAELEIREWTGKRAYCLYKSASDFRGAVLILLNKPKWDELEVPRHQREDQSRNMLKGSYTNGDF